MITLPIRFVKSQTFVLIIITRLEKPLHCVYSVQ